MLMPARQRLAVLIMAIVLLAALFTASPPMPGPGEVAAGPMPAPPRQTVGTPVSAAPNDVSDTAPRPPAPPRSCAPNILYTNVYTGDLGTSVTTQTGRGVRDGTASACSPPEAFPGALTGTGTLRYQSYPVVNTRHHRRASLSA